MADFEFRPAVAAVLALGPLPSEDDATEEQLEELDRRLVAVERPVTDREALTLATLFNADDNCYGLAWSLLHLIETAPGALTNPYPAGSGKEWLERLIARQQVSLELQAGESPP
ncbi:hypothetical protein [Actinomadura harenae]|uniref:hypothetical protein n=1 Tax=Actinomadura harenae TaxID=2483351 RepID=UPI001315A7C4|nr:hypothetical protein [Actinomadura harenae]